MIHTTPSIYSYDGVKGKQPEKSCIIFQNLQQLALLCAGMSAKTHSAKHELCFEKLTLTPVNHKKIHVLR